MIVFLIPSVIAAFVLGRMTANSSTSSVKTGYKGDRPLGYQQQAAMGRAEGFRFGTVPQSGFGSLDIDDTIADPIIIENQKFGVPRDVQRPFMRGDLVGTRDRNARPPLRRNY